MSKISKIFGGGQKVASPPPPPPPPPLPTREDPAIEDARKKQRMSELRRKGRASTILTSGKGVESPLGLVNQPKAESGKLGE